MVVFAQAAQIAVRRSAATVVGDLVVQVALLRAGAATGKAAASVAGAHEPGQRRLRPVGEGLAWWADGVAAADGGGVGEGEQGAGERVGDGDLGAAGQRGAGDPVGQQQVGQRGPLSIVVALRRAT